jgi:uncharacterized protein YjiS (DUF1127 family)
MFAASDDAPKEATMLQTFRPVIRSTSERARYRRQYALLLAADDVLLRDVGIRPDDVRARMARHAIA